MPNVSVVIGAGIVGLHIARLLQAKGHEVYVLDQAPYLAEHTSGRNSGVIHSGIFYKTDSFKEKICIEGNRLTYEWLERLKVPHSPCGKWIVPETGQEKDLEPFYEKICKLPIPTPQIKTADEVQSIDPILRRTRAILVPSTGILDAASYVKALANYLENKGVQIILNCRVLAAKDQILQTNRGDIPFDLAINSAGLFSDEIATMAGLAGYEIRPCRGDYFVMNKSPITRPVYHLPYEGAPGLGVHLTPSMDHQLLIGPNAFFIEKKFDYEHRTEVTAYQKAVQFFLPGLKNPSLLPAYSGNRPKLYKNNEPIGEFMIAKRNSWIHLLGIESPGLTAAPALAQEVVRLL